MDKVVSWILTFFVLIALLAILGNQLICLTDLEFDYINPYDSASRINYMFLPESITQGLLCFMFLVTGQWSMLLLSIPYLYYNVRLYLQKKHLVDVTEIYNQLNWEKRQRLYKLFYVINLLLLSLCRLLRTVGEDDD